MAIFEPSAETSSSPLISSAAASPVRMSRKQDEEPDSSTRTVRRLARAFGLSSPVSFARFDHATCSLRTLQACLLSTELWPEWSETWPDAAMWDSTSAYELAISEQPICESGCSLSPSWPTPNSHDAQGARGPGFSATDRHYKEHDLSAAIATWATPAEDNANNAGGPSRSRGKGAYRDLTVDVKQWQTPGTDSFRSRGGDRKDEMGLDQQARLLTWATPNCGDGSKTSKKSHQGRCLVREAETIGLEPSLPAPEIPAGPSSSGSGQTSRRRLNPRFVEWLLGLPIGWTEL